MTRTVFFKAVQDICKVFDDIAAATPNDIKPDDVSNIMKTVQVVLQQEKKIGAGVGY